MILCDECQKRIVAVFDNEGGKDDEKLIEEHLKDCPECRAFRDDVLRIREPFATASVPGISETVEKEIMQAVRSDSRRRENRYDGNQPQRLPIFARFPRLTWAAGLAALFLIAVSWLMTLSLARKVESLKEELETSRRELALAKEKEHLEEAQEEQVKAISDLHIRVSELEGQVRRGISPRMAWLSEPPYSRPERPSGL